MRYWKLIIGIITPLIFTIWLIPTAVSASFVIDHNDEVNKLRRQFAAEGMLRAFLTGPMEKSESYKKDIASVIGFQGPYDIEKFKVSEEYLYIEPFNFPVINKNRKNKADYIYISNELKEKVKNFLCGGEIFMRWVEKTAKTVDEAVDLALKELGIPREKAEVVIIDEGSKGILGIIGARPARVKVIAKQTPEEKIEEFLKSVFANMDVKIDRMDMVREGEFIKVSLFGKNTFKLIGKDGEVLDALQFLTGVVVNRGVPEEETVRILLDCQNFRKRKEERLKRLALSLADKVVRSKKSIKLRPMTPYERRIIHTTLQNHRFVTTYSEGEEPYRKVVITLK